MKMVGVDAVGASLVEDEKGVIALLMSVLAHRKKF
jgi:hypothetical protein